MPVPTTATATTAAVGAPASAPASAPAATWLSGTSANLRRLSTVPGSRTSYVPSAIPNALPVVLPVRSDGQGGASDVSMATDTSMHAAATIDTTPEDILPQSRSSVSVRSDDSEVLAELEMDLDPAGIVTLTLDQEVIEQRRVLEATATAAHLEIPRALCSRDQASRSSI